MSELRTLREEQRQKWLEEMQVKRKLEATKLQEEKTQKEHDNHWEHERIHAEIAAQVTTLEEANFLLEAYQHDCEFYLHKFVDGGLSYYKSKRIQDKYGIVRARDEARTETLLGPLEFITSRVPRASGAPSHQDENDALLQMAIHASLET